MATHPTQAAEILPPSRESVVSFEGYDVMVIAGQSNAVGVGAAQVDDELAGNKDIEGRIFQLGRCTYNGKPANKVIIPATDPLQHWGCDVEGASPNKKGFGLPFARRYVQKFLQPGRRVLLLPVAKSGSSILAWQKDARNRPNVKDYQEAVFYSDMLDRLNFVLKDSRNRLVAFHWQQGETDMGFIKNKADYNKIVTAMMSSADDYRSNLIRLFSQFKADVPQAANMAILMGEPSYENPARWTSPKVPYLPAEKVVSVMRDVAKSAHCGAFIESDGLLSNSAPKMVSTKDYVHFSGDGQIEMGRRRFKAYEGLSQVCQQKPVTVADSDLYDYLVMDTCLDKNGVQVSPLDAECVKRRNLEVGESIYFTGSSPGAKSIYIYNFPIATAGKDKAGNSYPLILHWIDHDNAGTFGTFEPNVGGGSDNVGIVSMIPKTEAEGGGYRAVDMVSTGGINVNFELGTNSTGSEKGVGRFNNSWVLGESFANDRTGLDNVPAVGVVHYDLFQEKLVSLKMPTLTGPKPPPLQADSMTGHYLSLRIRLDKFQFGGATAASAQPNQVLDTLIENKYADGISPGSPGDAGSVERVYLTRELGITRWEAWKRSDHPSVTGKDSEHTTADFFEAANKAYANCSPPATYLTYEVTPGFHMNDVVPVTSGPFSPYYIQEVTAMDSKGVWQKATWILQTCADWSKVVRMKAPVVPSLITPSSLTAPSNTPQNKMLYNLLQYFTSI